MTHCLQCIEHFVKSAQWLKEKDFRSQRFEHIPEMKYPREKRKKTSTTPKIQLLVNKFESGQGLFGLIWRKVTITLMFGLKLFLNEALEGFCMVGRSEAEE